jgi:nucleoside-diphosphate-sugar epimerase
MSLDDLASRACLVTGSTGFLGGWLVERLLAHGARVRCLVRSTSRRDFLPGSHVEYVLGDVTDVESLRRALAGVDYVFHVAGLIKAADPARYDQVNALGTRNVLSVAAERPDSIRRVVVVSSLAAVGPSRPGQPVDETWEPRPVSPYGKSKLQGEQHARSFARVVPLTIVRPPSIYGPRDRETLLVYRLANLPIRLAIGREGAISAIHVADLADGLLLAATRLAAIGQTYFLSGDESPSMSELLELIASALGRKGPAVSVPPVAIRAAGVTAGLIRDVTGRSFIFDRWKAEEIAIGHWACTSALARQQIGFQPQINLVEGLAATAAWYRKAGWL